MNHLTCTKCNLDLPEDQFHKDSSRESGRKSYCKECAKEYNRQWREENKEKHKEMINHWRATHREEYREQQRKWRESNPEYVPDTDEDIYDWDGDNVRCRSCGEYRHKSLFYFYGPNKRYIQMPCKICRKGE